MYVNINFFLYLFKKIICSNFELIKTVKFKCIYISLISIKIIKCINNGGG